MVQKRINVKDKLNSDGEVDLSMLDITDVPVKEISTLKKATTLNLYNNSISKLPANFPILTNLIKLDLSKNCLTELPENFGDLAKLKHLDLYQNQLKQLPLSFSKLKALKWLDLKENPLEPTLLKVAGPCENTKQCQTCARNIINYLTRQQNKADAEKEEKEKLRKKQLEMNEIKKKEEKKSKKKETQEIQKNGEVKVLTKTEKKKLKKMKKQSETKTSSNFSPLTLALLLLISLFILTAMKLKYLENFEKLIEDSYFKLVALLPADYQKYGEIFAASFKQVHLKTGVYCSNIIHYIQNNEYCILVYNTCREHSINLFSRIQSLYRNIVS
ncbi:leucine-rich repeat-containing protein 59-like [Coccinella septempunctata]|uniref:leucine-rich repeat-containing protein 59-like n=1 Tax=Coccinella septempunctata TaxID=41139 RepID=UPI001D06F654|nr:leucine-rich repeat-containing protein 59-like [Coccinella septempunctata]